MKLLVTDMPAGGEDIEFFLDLPALNKRTQAPIESAHESSFLPPSYEFVEAPKIILHVEKQGLTLFIEGVINSKFKTECSRCGETTLKNINGPIKLVLKPFEPGKKKEEQVEDLGFGFYDGREVDCAEIAEEYLMLALPFNALCSDDCKGLCPKCGVNLNASKCSCFTTKVPDPRFAILQKLKIQ